MRGCGCGVRRVRESPDGLRVRIERKLDSLIGKFWRLGEAFERELRGKATPVPAISVGVDPASGEDWGTITVCEQGDEPGSIRVVASIRTPGLSLEEIVGAMFKAGYERGQQCQRAEVEALVELGGKPIEWTETTMTKAQLERLLAAAIEHGRRKEREGR